MGNDLRVINTMKTLIVDSIQKANSGHPGLAMGSSPMAYTLWSKHLKNTASDSKWADRDRFVLSAGHASMLQYSLLHLFGYKVSMDDLKQFRQVGSNTPGHPEYGMTDGVDVTTGPLGAGLSMAVGMAMAETRLAAKFNTPEHKIVDHFTYVLAGDGCMMEGITSEASSLAGHLGLGKLIVLYDDNKITIDGSTDLAFTENIDDRYRSYNWQVLHVADGNDLAAIDKAICEAKAETNKPTMIRVTTVIADGSLNQGSAKTHGAPLGDADIKQLKEKFGFDPEVKFFVADDVRATMAEIIESKKAAKDAWDKMFADYSAKNPELAKEWNKWHSNELCKDATSMEKIHEVMNKTDATRNSGGIYMNYIKPFVPQLMGGSADLNGSTKTYLNGAGDYQKNNRNADNFFFGIREHAMGAICNGLALHGGIRPYCATFMVFSDYMKPAIRLSALMHLPVIYVFTHDSIGVGEDGATHQPIEHLMMLRTIPNTKVYRPADPRETAVAWVSALQNTTGPSVLILSRQNLKLLENVNDNAYKGGYVVSAQDSGNHDGILIATGSEVGVMMEAQAELKAKGKNVSVVSVLSKELFEAQSCEYKSSVLPKDVRKRVVMEAAITLGWESYATEDGAIIGINRFGESGPGDKLFAEFGLTKEAVVEKFLSL